MSSSGLSSADSDFGGDASTAATSPPEPNTKSIVGQKRKAITTTKQVKRTKVTATASAKRASAVKVQVKESEESDEEEESPPEVEKSKPKKPVKRAVKAEAVTETVNSDGEVTTTTKVTKKVSKPRKTKQEKEAEAMPLAARTIGSKIVVGAHVSAAGGVHNAVLNSVHIGANAFALFMKSQRKWVNPPLSKEHAAAFKANCKTHSVESDKNAVPHGSYLVNLAHIDVDRTKQAYDSFLDDLTRCNELGIQLYNFHPGNCASSSRDEAIRHLALQINRAHKEPSTGTVITLLETMATAGNTIGTTFPEIKAIIDLVNDKARVGVCLDTCHVFAAGYDLRTPQAYNATMEKFDKEIGLKYLQAFHVNDSKAPLGSNKDLHANIGTGFLGLRAFHNLVNDSRIWGLPLILETPIGGKDDKGKATEDHGIYAREIKLLESLVGMDVESEEFLKLEKELHESGEAERARIQDQVDRKAAGKGSKKTVAKITKATKKPAKGKKAKEESDSEGGESGEDTA